MLESLFATGSTTSVIELAPFLVSIAAALVLGLALALVYCYRARHTRSFVMTLALLPAIVCVVIAMVNGNVGAGVAVAGAFSLVRFRSVPGSARDISFIFLAMCVGLVCGMGYVLYAALVTVVIGAASVLFQVSGIGGHGMETDKTLRVTVPEDLDFTGLFDDVFERYTTYHDLTTVKTTNMGSLYKLTYNAQLKSVDVTRRLIDDLRCRNGNLEIALSYQEANGDEL